MIEACDVPILVINLERSTERRARMQAAFHALKLRPTFFPAVDGRALTTADLARYDRSRARRIYGSEMTPSEIGCCLSHLAVLQEVTRHGWRHALICEDDLQFAPSFSRVLGELVNWPEAPWQVVRLNALKGRVLAPRTKRDTGLPIARLPDGTLYRLNSHPLGAGAYLVTHQGAEAIVRHAGRIFAPWDHMLDRFWENGILPYVVRPFPVWQDPALDSDIGWPRGTKAFTSNPLGIALRRLQRVSDSAHKRLFLLRLRHRPEPSGPSA